MACRDALIAALCTKLSDDDDTGGLVRILQHAPTKGSNYDRIGVLSPDVCNDERNAYLGIQALEAAPLIYNTLIPVFRDTIRLMYCACGHNASRRVTMTGDRIMQLLFGLDGKSAPVAMDNRWFLNFSNCDVTIKSNVLSRRKKLGDYKEETDKICEYIDIAVVYACEGCENC